MKKASDITICMLLALYAFLPVFSLVLYIFGYTVSLFNYAVFSALLASTSVAATIFVSVKKEWHAKRIICVLAAFLPLLAVINWVVYLFKSQDIRGEAVVVTVCMPICLICAVILTVKLCKSVFLKTAGIFIPLLSVIPLAFLTFIILLPMGKNTVMGTVTSPSGTYYAEIVDSDQGVLGGSTLVYVHKNGETDAFLFTIRKKRERVYLGDWGEYEDMQIYWKNEHCLVINSREYTITQ